MKTDSLTRQLIKAGDGTNMPGDGEWPTANSDGRVEYLAAALLFSDAA